jgi:hypothetical protein
MAEDSADSPSHEEYTTPGPGPRGSTTSSLGSPKDCYLCDKDCVQCVKCRRWLCKGCAVKCKARYCSSYSCPSCLELCRSCQNRVCTGCIRTCVEVEGWPYGGCEGRFCTGCMGGCRGIGKQCRRCQDF